MASEHITHQGKRFELQPFGSEAELERVVVRRASEIFGKKTIFFEMKALVASHGNILGTGVRLGW